jgi:hypothetical protein
MVFSSSGEERRLVMSTKMGFWRWALASTAILIATGTAGARVIDPTGVTTQEPAGIVLYPRLKVDLNTCVPEGGTFPGTCSLTPTVSCSDDDDCQNTCVVGPGTCSLTPVITCSLDAECPGAAIDTIVQLTNTSEFLTKVVCFYTNTNSHCSNAPDRICTDANFRDVCPRGGLCRQDWVETDFHLTLTKRQPISWSVNDGLSALPLNSIPGQGNPPQFNEGNIPPVGEIPFTGELICIEVDISTELPSDRNDYKGEATIVKTIRADIDANKYNAIGIKAIEGRQTDPPGVLNIGGPDAEYGVFNDTVDPPRFGGCPNVITLNHFFDGANVVTHDDLVQGSVNSELTIVPCQRDYLTQTFNGPDITVQFLVFNEFEQRFSTSTKVSCYKEVRLSDIGDALQPGPANDQFSIFNVGVEGTITGMSRLRSVAGPNIDGYDGRTILALLTENWAAGRCLSAPAMTETAGVEPIEPEVTLCATQADCDSLDPGTTCMNPFIKTTSANPQFQGSRLQGDRITIPVP